MYGKPDFHICTASWVRVDAVQWEIPRFYPVPSNFDNVHLYYTIFVTKIQGYIIILLWKIVMAAN